MGQETLTATAETAAGTVRPPISQENLFRFWDQLPLTREQRETWIPSPKLFRWATDHIELVAKDSFQVRFVIEYYLRKMNGLAWELFQTEVRLVADKTTFLSIVPEKITPKPDQQDLKTSQSTTTTAKPLTMDANEILRARKRIGVPYPEGFSDLVFHPGNRFAVDETRALVKILSEAGSFRQAACLIGPNGVGKTALLSAAMNALLKKRRSSAYLHLELLAKFFQHNEGTPPLSLVEARKKKWSLLAIDDLGGLVKRDTEAHRPGVQTSVLDLWQHAESSEKPIVCAYTGSQGDLCSLTQKISEVSGDLADRLGGMSLIPIDVPAEGRALFIEELLERTGKAPDAEELAAVVDYLDRVIEKGASVRRITGFYVATLTRGARAGSITAQLAQAHFGQMELFDPAAVLKDDPKRILELAERLFPDVPVAAIISPSRKKEVFQARMRLIWLMKELTGATDNLIGYLLGKRDTSTINHALSKARESLTDEEKKRLLAEIRELLKPR